MFDEKMLAKYAELIVVSGVNIKKDQPVFVRADFTALPLARAVVKAAYEHGAKKVYVQYGDETISRMHYEYQSIETLADIPEWAYDARWSYCKEGACLISIVSGNPDIMNGISSERLHAGDAKAYANPKFNEMVTYSMSNQGQWIVVAYPSVDWAKKVFPELSEKAAYKKLSEAILAASRVTKRNDPIKEWVKHSNRIKKNYKVLNSYNFKSLHYTNALGTDLTIDIVKNHIWAGGAEKAANGIVFNPNIPTEEVFTMPAKFGVNGKVVATKPLNFGGKLIENFWLKFENGRVVEYDAEKGLDALKSLIETDEGSHYIGEVALVPFDSPINNSGILFYNTLFDENASCHLALGRAYPMNLKGGVKMTQEELSAAGANFSHTHNDFMIGSKDLSIVGTTYDGKEVQVFKDGNFAF